MELRLLKENHATMTDEKLSALIGRTVFAVRQKQSALNLNKDPSFRKKILRENMLRTKAIGLKKLGYGWTKEDDKKLVELYNKNELTLADIAKEMKRTVSTIGWRLRKLKVPIKNINNKRGYEGERLAKRFFENVGWEILERGNKHTPYDFIVKIENKKYAINVKMGTMHLHKSNVRRLMAFASKGYSIAFLYIESEKNIYFMPLHRMS